MRASTGPALVFRVSIEPPAGRLTSMSSASIKASVAGAASLPRASRMRVTRRIVFRSFISVFSAGRAAFASRPRPTSASMASLLSGTA